MQFWEFSKAHDSSLVYLYFCSFIAVTRGPYPLQNGAHHKFIRIASLGSIGQCYGTMLFIPRPFVSRQALFALMHVYLLTEYTERHVGQDRSLILRAPYISYLTWMPRSVGIAPHEGQSEMVRTCVSANPLMPLCHPATTPWGCRSHMWGGLHG